MIKLAPFAFAAAAIFALPVSAQTLSGGALNAAVSGKSIAYAGGPTQRFNRDGSMTASTAGLTGTWSIKNNRLCTKWTGIDSETCVRVAKQGDGLKLTASDGRTWNASYK